MKNMMTFKKLQDDVINFILKHNNVDHIVLMGKNNILISAPHAVSQVRLGMHKYSEEGSLKTALSVFKNTNCFLISKTKNNFDDANFDEKSEYKTSVENLIKKHHIQYIVDFHGLSPKRNCDVNLGTHLGQNVKTNEELFMALYNALKSKNFNTQIDAPFMANRNTISSSMANKYPNVWTVQIEINCNITDKKENFSKFETLVEVLTNWICSI